jgi:hypothetical protein
MVITQYENERNSDAWDNLCTNPHHHDQEDGRERGRHDGSIAGYNEGYNIGRTTAISNGMEIGFIQGVLVYLMTEGSLSAMLIENEKVERAQKSIQNLQIAIDEFPSPESLIDRSTEDKQAIRETNVHDDDDDNSINTTNDISNKLQRIRARFKLLMVQLGLSHVSLKQLMDINVHAATANLNNSDKIVVQSDIHDTTEW